MIKICYNCERETSLLDKEDLTVCIHCGFIYKSKIIKTDNIQRITVIFNNILDECLPLFKIHQNVSKTIKRRMLKIIRLTPGLGKMVNVDSIVFTLMIYAIRDLRIPVNNKIMNETIQRYINEHDILKHLKNLEI